MKKKLIDAEAWLKQCNQSWMHYNLAKLIIAKAPCYEGRARPPLGAGEGSAKEWQRSQRPSERSEGEAMRAPQQCWCRACGAQIVWVKMQSGKKMPCDAELIHAVADEKAKTSFVLPCGIIKRGTIGRHPDGTADFVGYRSHFETCPKAEEFRKRGKEDA